MSQYRRSIVPDGTYFFTQVTYQRHHWLCQDLARKTLRQAIIQVQHKSGAPHLILSKMYLTKVILYNFFSKSHKISLI